MPCIHCYISWAESIAVYLPSLLAPLFVWLFYGGTRAGAHDAVPPTYGPLYLPAFVRGILAAYRLGKDEDEFLSSLKRTYGPIVYLPWPFKQYFVNDPATAAKVWETSTSILAFAPIRMSMQCSVFGGSTPIFRDTTLWHGILFPAHGRGLSKIRLEEPIATFVSYLRDELDHLGQRIDAMGSAADTSSERLEMDLVAWIRETMFDCGLAAVYGPQLLDFESSSKYGISSLEEFRRCFDDFDYAFPLVAGEVLPLPALKMFPFIRKGLKARDRLRQFIAAWVRDGTPGLQEGGLVKDMVDYSRANGLTDLDIGTTLNGTLWYAVLTFSSVLLLNSPRADSTAKFSTGLPRALQANGPFAAVWIVLYIIQSPLYPKILQEIESFSLSGRSPTQADLAPSTALPILSSAIYETLRLGSSTSSLRDVEKTFLLCADRDDELTKEKEGIFHPNRGGQWIPQGSRVAAVMRAVHLDEDVWKDAKLWDGERFIDREGEEPGTRSKRTREVRAFGGGVSICEGRHLAYSELKAMVAETLSRFEISVSSDQSSSMRTLRFIDGSTGVAPQLARGRPGMGIFQFDGDVKVRVKRRVGTE
ncbi:BQ2448_4064 [Microbotryum intermedium]|uniref:BQ2448_4064 protein n=1 Tax=Microbotryum intermedium TaxID=269621 RepID=A0A238FH25_9BASI|nr:BQ2448_4064 [Microbotryum intermedium]